MSARPRHVEPNDRIPFGTEKYPPQASPIDGHSVLLNLSGKALEHVRTKVVPFGILIPDPNHGRKSEAKHHLFGHVFEILDRDFDGLFRLSEDRASRLPPKPACDDKH